MANVAWGIDIGNRALKGVKLARAPEGLKIIDFAFIEHDTILSEAGDNREALVQTALAKFVGRHDTKKTPFCVGVSGQQSFARFVKLPPVEVKKVPEIVKFEAVQQIPFPLDEVEWSYQLFQKPEDPDIEVGIFAMRKELVNERVGNFLEVDLDVHAVQTSPLAVYNAMRYDGRLDKGHSIVIDLGADSTDLIIADAESIWMRSLDIGGNNFTEALAKAFKIDFEKAEEMKRNAKTSKYAKQIYQAMRPVFGDLVSEVQRSLGFFNSGHRDVKLRKVIALGGGFKLNGLSGYVQKNLQMPVEKPTKFAALPPDEPGAAASLAEHVLSAPAAYGMALQLVEETKVSSSLLPTQIRRDKLWKDKTKWFGLAAGLVVGAAFIGFASYLYNDMAFNSARGTRNEVDQALQEAQGYDAQWTAVTNDGRAELQQVKNVNALVLNRTYWGQFLERLFAAMPAPEGELAQALQGRLGNPGEFDDADVQAIRAVPRTERAYVTIVKIESVYSDDLGSIVNQTSPLSSAESILKQKNRTRYSGLLPTLETQTAALEGDARTIKEENARGFVVRLTLVTPLPFREATQRFRDDLEDAIHRRLIRIGPDAQNQTLPFAVPWAEIELIRPLTESPDRLRQMEAAYNARMNMGIPPTVGGAAPTTGPATARATPTPGAGTPSGAGAAQSTGGTRGGTRGGRGSVTQAVDVDNPAYLDPITGELRLQDTEIQVLFVLQLDPPPYQPPAQQEEGQDAGQVAGAR